MAKLKIKGNGANSLVSEGDIAGVLETLRQFQDTAGVLSRVQDALREVENRPDLLQRVEKYLAFHKKHEAAASEFLELYWDESSRLINIEALESYVEKNQPLNVWFFVNLIQLAGDKAMETGYRQYKSKIAQQKNSIPRAWVLDEWKGKTDKGQSKEAFARQYAALVKTRFKLSITARTIATVWLPKGKKTNPKKI